MNLWDFHQDVRENLFKTLMGKANELVSAWQEEIDEANEFLSLVFGLLGIDFKTKMPMWNQSNQLVHLLVVVLLSDEASIPFHSSIHHSDWGSQTVLKVNQQIDQKVQQKRPGFLHRATACTADSSRAGCRLPRIGI